MSVIILFPFFFSFFLHGVEIENWSKTLIDLTDPCLGMLNSNNEQLRGWSQIQKNVSCVPAADSLTDHQSTASSLMSYCLFYRLDIMKFFNLRDVLWVNILMFMDCSNTIMTGTVQIPYL